MQLELAVRDVIGGARNYHLWGLLGWQDVRQRYRRSILGPWWLTMSSAVMVAGLGFVYHAIFKIPLGEYLPFLASGLIVWMLISTIVVESCQVFVSNEQIIKQIRLPFTLYACRLVWRNVITFAHNIVIAFGAVLIFGVNMATVDVLLLMLGVAVLIVNGIWVAIILGAISTRFRDIPPIVASVMQLCFFVTPIIWHPSLLTGRQRVVDFNPFYHFVEIMRAPILGGPLPINSWTAVALITLAGWLITIGFLVRYRRRIAFWL